MTTNRINDRQSKGTKLVAGLGSQPKVNQYNKAITLRTLAQLKQRLYTQAARAQQSSPQQAQAIQRRVDQEASHIAFVINMASSKL